MGSGYLTIHQPANEKGSQLSIGDLKVNDTKLDPRDTKALNKAIDELFAAHGMVITSRSTLVVEKEKIEIQFSISAVEDNPSTRK